jgi:1-acyl-sn-glycerol-3-phosphate acyltransferase
MLKAFRILAHGSGFVVYSFLGAIIGYVLLPLARAGGRTETEKIKRCQDVLHLCCRFYIWYMRVVGVLRLKRPPVPEPLVRREACVVISNHPSLLDVIVITSSVPAVVFVAKASWFRSPFIAPLLHHCGHIPGPADEDTPTPMDGALVLERVLSRLRQGFPVLVFPEGTRSPPRSLNPYHRGAFEAAIRAKVPLVGLRFLVDPPALLKNQAWYEVPDRRINYDLDLMFVRYPADFPESARALRKQVYEEYSAVLGLDGSNAPQAATDHDVVPPPSEGELLTEGAGDHTEASGARKAAI